MNQDEVKAAITEQEEHIKRQSSCNGVVGQAHHFRPYGKRDKTEPRNRVSLWSQCTICGVTETARDYESKTRKESQ